MNIDVQGLFKRLKSRLKRDESITDDMDSIISFCEKCDSHPDWSRFRSIGYKTDLNCLRSWLPKALRDDPPKFDVAGLWFGLFNPATSRTDVWADMYVCGSRTFDATGESNEWACGSEYHPKGKYANSNALRRIYKTAYRDEDSLGNDAEYPLCLAYAAFAVKRLMQQLDPELIVRGVPSVGVTVGFDSGDWVTLGEIDRSGFHVRPR